MFQDNFEDELNVLASFGWLRSHIWVRNWYIANVEICEVWLEFYFDLVLDSFWTFPHWCRTCLRSPNLTWFGTSKRFVLSVSLLVLDFECKETDFDLELLLEVFFGYKFGKTLSSLMNFVDPCVHPGGGEHC